MPPPRAHAPISALPLAYFAFAHLCLALALAVLIFEPTLPGGFVYHPRLIALVHLVTLGWITASILGALYIVCPVALMTPLPVKAGDWAVFAAYAGATLGMVAHFWIGRYDGMAWSAGLVLLAAGHIERRVARGLPAAIIGPAIVWHVRLAFMNLFLAGALGIVIGIDKSRGLLALSPLATAFTHAHLAAVGWAVMITIGIAYRLVPMLLPARMPARRGLSASAFLIESGLAVLVIALFARLPIEPLGAALTIAGFGVFFWRMAGVMRQTLPRPPALPVPDWSLWHVRTAFAWLVVAAVLGCALSVVGAATHQSMAWVYGTAGLIGFLAQVIAGMQGRLVPYYAWYRALDALGGAQPPQSAHSLPAPRFALSVFICWLAGVPLLAWGLAGEQLVAIRAASVLIIAGLVLQAAHIAHMLRKARTHDGHSPV